MQLDYHEIKSKCTHPTQHRYEAIRPLLFNPEYGMSIRVQETHIAERTLRKYMKAFNNKGFDGLKDSREMPWNKGKPQIPQDIRLLIGELKMRSPDIPAYEVQKYLISKGKQSVDLRTLKKWIKYVELEPLSIEIKKSPNSLYEKKVEAIKLKKRGLSAKTIAQWVGTSVSTVKRTLSKFKATKSLASLEPRHTEAHVPKQVFNFKNLNRVMRLQKKFPQTGSWRITEMLKQEGLDCGRSTVAKMMQFNREHYLTPPSKPHYPSNAPRPTHRHQYWFVDVRYLTVYERKQAYSICILEGYSRKILAGEATHRQNLFTLLKVLYPAVKTYGVPDYFVSDNAKIFTCAQFLKSLSHLQIKPNPITKGKPWQNLIESFFGIERRILDPIIEKAQNFHELRLFHQQFLDYYNASSHYAHRFRADKKRTPNEVLSWVKGKNVLPHQLREAFDGMVIERCITRAGYVRLHNFHLFICTGRSGQWVKIKITETQVRIEMQEQTWVEFSCELFTNHELKKVWNPYYHSKYVSGQQLSLFNPEDEVWPSHFKGRRKKHKRNSRIASKQLRIPFEDLGDWIVS